MRLGGVMETANDRLAIGTKDQFHVY
jgi:hypothetical protein